MMKAEYRNIHAALGGREILKGISLQVPEGGMTGIIGPNGCGKSTFVKTTFGICPYQQGEILVDGIPVKQLGRKKLAARVGYVGQDAGTVFNFSVYEVVAYGRHPAGTVRFYGKSSSFQSGPEADKSSHELCRAAPSDSGRLSFQRASGSRRAA